MSLEISAKTEVLIAAKAQEKGLSIDAFLERLLIDAGPLHLGNGNGPPHRNRQEQLADDRQIAFRDPVQQSVQIATINAHSLKISWTQDTACGISNPQRVAAQPSGNWLVSALCASKSQRKPKPSSRRKPKRRASPSTLFWSVSS